MPMIAGLSQEAVTTVDDFFFESNASGEVNPILTTSRTNLITYSEDISNATWAKNLVTAASSIASPVSSASFLIEETSYSSSVPSLQLTSGISVSAGTYTASFYVKNNSGRYLGISFGVSSERIRTNFDFNTETFKTAIFTGSTTGSVSFEKDGDFYRISIKATFPSTVAAVLVVTPLATDTYPFFAFQDSDNRSFHVSGFQLEQDIFASAYIKTSGSAVTVSTTLNDTSEVWDFDSTDIMLEADPEDEGFWEEGNNLVLNHDYEDLGSELVPSIVTSENNNGGVINYISDNIYSSTSDGTAGSTIRPKFTFATTSGKTYKLVITPTGTITGTINFDFYDGSSYLFQNYDFTTTKEIHFTDNGSVFGAFDGTQTYSITGFTISIKQVDPNDRWSLGTGWSIEDGKLIATSTDAEATQSSIITPGNTYEVTFTVDSISSGEVRVKAGTTFGTSINSAGTYTQIFDVLFGSNIAIDMVASGSCVIDNVTVREYAVQPKDI